MRTTDEILGFLKTAIENEKHIPQDKWIDAAFSLNTLILGEVEKLEDLRQKVATEKYERLKIQEGKKNVSMADLEVETLPLYKEMKLQDAKVDVIKEFIRIAKSNAHNL